MGGYGLVPAHNKQEVPTFMTGLAYIGILRRLVGIDSNTFTDPVKQACSRQ